MTRRQNPVRTGKHPDLFDGDTDVIIENWRELSTKQLSQASADDFDEETLDEIQDEDEDLYDALWERAEERQLERIEPFVQYWRERAIWARDDATDEHHQEGEVDHFVYMLSEMTNDDILSKIGDDNLYAAAEEVQEEPLGEILRDPDMYEILTEGAGHRHEVASWEQNTASVYGDFEDDELTSAIDLLKKEADLDKAKEILEDEVYVSFPNTKWANLQKMMEKGYGDIDGEVSVDIRWSFYVKDIDAMLEAIAELPLQESKDEGPETDDIVYRFPDGFYVADLRANQLPAEGRKQGMCVGRADMGYIEGVREGSIKIFSLRRPGGKPLLTIEYDVENDEIDQVKGKANRLPGFAAAQHDAMTRADEVHKAAEFIYKHLKLDPSDAEDMLPGMVALKYKSRDGKLYRENPVIRVSARVKKLADEAYRHPMGGEWS